MLLSEIRLAHMRRLYAAWRKIAAKAGFNPDQPRVPAGNPDGGQWTSGEGATGDSAVRLAAEKPRLGPAAITALAARVAKRLIEAHKGRVVVRLKMWGHPELGVLLIWSKWGGGHKETFSSKGDLTRVREWVRSTHDTPLPVGLFIPFEEAWKAVKEFIETDGALPKSIEWVANRDLPPNTFPDP